MCLFGGSTKVVHYRDRGTYIGEGSQPGTSSALPLGSGPNGKSPAEAEPRCRSANRRPETKEKAIPGAGEN